ncbi:MAG: hypothetical protein Q9204_002500 [Flavoplaca sp. TL-2023a]
MRNVSPLKENGPDPVADKDILTEEWLVQKLQSKHVPVKALLLDQANISGIGNWVGDELLYNAKIHPEQYSNTLSPAQMKQLHESIHYVCSTAVELLAESDRFPEEWLFKHRWAKGKKDAPQRLPNGAKIKFVTVGGRTSAIVPSVQKKTGEVAADVKERDSEEEENGAEEDDVKEQKPKSTLKRKVQEDGEEDDQKPASKKKSNKKLPTTSRGKKQARKGEEAITAQADGVDGSHPTAEANITVNGGKKLPKPKATKNEEASKPPTKSSKRDESSGRRRSARISTNGK